MAAWSVLGVMLGGVGAIALHARAEAATRGASFESAEAAAAAARERRSSPCGARAAERAGAERSGPSLAGPRVALAIEAQRAYRLGLDRLTEGELELAALHFRRALDLDARLARSAGASPFHRQSSYLRRSIVEAMRQRSTDRGHALASKGDFAGACRAWRLGLTFAKDGELLHAATQQCSPRGSAALARAQHCGDLAAARDFILDGDGNQEALEARAVELGCRPRPEAGRTASNAW